MPFTSFPAELHSIKLRFVFGAGALAKIWTCFHFFESISILLSRSHTFPFRTFLYLLLLATLSSFFPTQFCWANFPILEKKGILCGKDSRSGGGELNWQWIFPKMSGRIGQTLLLRCLYKDQSFLNSYLKNLVT